MSAEEFWNRGYLLAERLLDSKQLAFARGAMDASRRNGKMRTAASKIVAQTAHNEYSPIGGEVLLLQCLPAIAATVGAELLPAYAFWRIYEHGSALLRHVDRGACEVSATVTIAADPPDSPWPLKFQPLVGESLELALQPGDSAIYQGCKVPHWRDPFTGQTQYQLFLHYVRKDGPNAALAFDGRSGLRLNAGAEPEG
jgi:hypothetical protein